MKCKGGRAAVLAAALLLALAGVTAAQVDEELGDDWDPVNFNTRAATASCADITLTSGTQLVSLNDDPKVGIMYIPDGVYQITQSVTFSKPIIATRGAIFNVSPLTASLYTCRHHWGRSRLALLLPCWLVLPINSLAANPFYPGTSFSRLSYPNLSHPCRLPPT
jgi:hypothetical protein